MKSSRTCRGQILKAKAEAEDKSSRTRTRTRTKCWPPGQLVLDDLTSLEHTTYLWTVVIISILHRFLVFTALYLLHAHVTSNDVKINNADKQYLFLFGFYGET